MPSVRLATNFYRLHLVIFFFFLKHGAQTNQHCLGKMQIYWCLNADVFHEANAVVFIVWVCFFSMDLLKSAQHSLCSIILMYY